MKWLVTVAPQSNGSWGASLGASGKGGGAGVDSLAAAFDIIAKLQKEFTIDPARIYVLGSSMGGYGSWSAITRRPDLFAAAIPVCGGMRTQNVKGIVDVPIWCFHGGNDRTVPAERSRSLFEALQKLGGNMKYTEFPGVGHSSWLQAFAFKGDDKDKGIVTKYASDKCDKEGDVWAWLFGQKRKKAPRGS